MRQIKKSGPPENGEVLITGIRGTCRFVRSKIPGVTVRDNGDGTAAIVLPPDMKPGEGANVFWEDDDGMRPTACVMPNPSQTLEQRVAALERQK